MKLFDQLLHLIEQNHDKMNSPPITERDFARLVKEHSRIINKVCYFYSSEKLPFDDLRQEIYVNIWQGLNQFRGESKMSAMDIPCIGQLGTYGNQVFQNKTGYCHNRFLVS